MDRDLSMNSHISKMLQAGFSAFRQIRSIKKCFSYESFRTLAVALILSRIDYCNTLLAGLPERANNLVLEKKFFTETATRKFLTHGLPQSSSETFMIGSGESRGKATGIKKDILSTKVKTRIGFLHLRKMFEAGRLTHINAKRKK